MKVMQSLLAASVLVAAAGANATVYNLAGTLNSQVPPAGSITLGGNLNLSGEIDVDISGNIQSFWLSTNGSYTSTSSLGPVVTFAAGSRWDAVVPVGGIAFDSFAPSGSGYLVKFIWGDDTSVDSNDGATLTYSTAPSCNSDPLCGFAMSDFGWDHVTLDVYLDSSLAVTSVDLVTLEVGAFGSTTSSYSLSEVPLPAAAWLFGSGLIGLVGTARRRRAAARVK